MSRGPRASCRHAATEDDGFSLIEVVVALGVFLVVMTAVLPLIVGGLRGTARAGQVTEQKGVVEAQLERMRNLPWHVAPNAGQFIDVLDRYFPNLTAPTVTVNATTCAVYYEVVSMARGWESDTAEIYVIPYPSFNYPWKDRLERSVNDITMEYSEWIIICVLVIFLPCLGWEAWGKHKDAQQRARAAFPFLWTGPYPTKKRALKKWARVMDNHRSAKMPNWANVKNAANQRFKELYGHGVME